MWHANGDIFNTVANGKQIEEFPRQCPGFSSWQITKSPTMKNLINLRTEKVGLSLFYVVGYHFYITPDLFLCK